MVEVVLLETGTIIFALHQAGFKHECRELLVIDIGTSCGTHELYLRMPSGKLSGKAVATTLGVLSNVEASSHV